MLVAGVDVGSTTTKAALLDENKRVRALALVDTGANVVRAAERALRAALAEFGREDFDVAYTVGTGYGRYRVPFGDLQITEISCHAKGAHFLFPATRTVLDMGGQDTKAIRVGPAAEVRDFCMNDKCAAGTGRFLEATAEVLGLCLEELGEVSARALKTLKVTNVCTVFVEQEIVMHLARGCPVEEILAGLHWTIAGRSIGLLRRVGLEPEITFTGGVARNAGVVRALEQRLGSKLNVAPESQHIGAIGAALFAWERAAHGAVGRRNSAGAGAAEARPAEG
jgi:predicted CoA-substrate-specific enzyme activase